MPEQGRNGNIITASIGDGEAGLRLDRALLALVEGLSRSRLQALIKVGEVTRNGVPVTDPGQKVRAGEAYAVTIPEAEPAEPQGEAIDLDVVHEDADLIVIDKPAGLVVHPSAGHQSGTLVNALIAHCGESLSGIGGVKRPGIVHRLDKDTSGLLVVAKTDLAHQSLSAQFAAHGRDGRLERRYLALVWGKPQPQIGTVSAALQRSSSNRTKIAVTLGVNGREAITHYRVVEVVFGSEGKLAGVPIASLVELQLETGRTHQIRVHMAYIGHPVMGDVTYGAGFKASIAKLPLEAAQALAHLGRQALHAKVLGFEHPRSARAVRFESPVPDDMQRLIDRLHPARSRTVAVVLEPKSRRKLKKS